MLIGRAFEEYGLIFGLERDSLENEVILDVASGVFRFLMSIRELPSRLFGKGERFFWEDGLDTAHTLENSIFAVLGKEENKEAVFGLVGRFWDVINTDPTKVAGVEEFKAFNRPEYGKAAMSFYLEPNGGRTRLTTEARAHFQDKKIPEEVQGLLVFHRSFQRAD